MKFFTSVQAHHPPGRPSAPGSATAFQNLCEYLLSNDECQYSLTELNDKYKEYMAEDVECITEKTLKSKLMSYFGEQIIVTSAPGRKNLVCFRDTAHKILTASWYTERAKDSNDERRRIVETAAAIVREDIRSVAYVWISILRLQIF